jgi:hypothetical protein
MNQTGGYHVTEAGMNAPRQGITVHLENLNQRVDLLNKELAEFEQSMKPYLPQTQEQPIPMNKELLSSQPSFSPNVELATHIDREIGRALDRIRTLKEKLEI